MIIRKYKTLLITSTLPTFIGATALLFFMFSDILNAVSVSFVCSLVIGIVLFLEGLFCSRFSPRAWGISIFQFIIIPITGLILTGIAFWPAAYAPQGVYTQVAPPPETPIKFVQGSTQNIFGFNLFVQTVSGQTYMYDCIYYDRCTWVLQDPSIDQPDSEVFIDDYYDCPQDIKTPFMSPIPPFGVSDKIFIRNCGPDYEIQARYILLNNGKIYRWSRYWNPLVLIVGVPGFGLIGFISGLSTAIATLAKRKKSVIPSS